MNLRRCFDSCILLSLLFASSAFAGPDPLAGVHPSVDRLKEGSYFGYTVVKNQSFKVPTALEIIKTNEDVSYKDKVYTTYFAILKFSLGGFDSIEYTTQDYRIYVHKEFTLERNLEKNRHNHASFINTSVSDDGLTIKGQLQSKFTSIFGSETILQYWDGENEDDFIAKQDALFPEHDIVPAITGDYEGNCAGRLRRLQLMAVKNSQQNGSLLKGFKIEGRHGFRPIQSDYDRDFDLPRLLSVYSGRIKNSSYNFFKNKVIVPGFAQSQCWFENGKTGVLVCGDKRSESNTCRLFKKSKAISNFDLPLIPYSFINHHNLHYLKMSSERTVFSKDDQTPGEKLNLSQDCLEEASLFAGKFQYAHDDFSQRFLLNMDVNGTTNGDAQAGLYLTLNAKIFLGEKDLDDAPYFNLRFPAIGIQDSLRFHDKIVAVGPQFVVIFEFVETNGKSGIRGEVYARDYGYFGKFATTKLEDPAELYLVSGDGKVFPDSSILRQNNSYGDRIDGALDIVFSPASHFDSNRDDVEHFYFDYGVVGGYKTRKEYAGELNFLPVEKHSAQSIEEESGYDPFTRTLFLSFAGGSFFYGQQDGSEFRGVLSSRLREGRSSLEELVEWRLHGNSR